MIKIKGAVFTLSTCALLSCNLVQAETLEQAVFNALQKSPDMAQTMQQYYAAKSDVDIATASFLPQLDLTADAGKEDLDRERIGETNKDRTNVRLSLTVPVFRGFASVNEHDRASFQVKSSYYQTLAKAENITLSLTKAYIDMLSAKDVITMSEENLAHHQKTYDLIKERSVQGVASKADLSQIRSRLARAKANMISARSNYNNAEIQYIEIAGKSPSRLTRPKVNKSYLPENNQRVVDIAFANHQSLFSSQYDIKAASSATKVQNAHYYPEFDVVVDRTWKEDVAGFNGHEDEWRVLLEMKWNLFAGGQKSSAHSKALHNEKASKMKLNTVQRAVKANANASWNAYELLEQERIFLKEHVEQTKETEKLYSQQFQAGRRSLLDLLDSQNELFQSRKAFISADYDYLYAQYRVVASMSYILDALQVNVMEGLNNEN